MVKPENLKTNSFGSYYRSMSYQNICDNKEFINEELLNHKVLVFKNIKISLEDQVILMQHLYPSSNYLKIFKDEDHAQIFNLFKKHERTIPDVGHHFMRWNTDGSSLEEPIDINCIYMHHFHKNNIGGETRWVDLEKIYTLLDDETINFLKTVKVKKDWGPDDVDDPLYRENCQGFYHSALRTHPETNKISIFYPGLTTLGKDQDKWSEYNKLLNDLFEDHNSTFILSWEENDLVIWDNRNTAYCSMGGFELGSRIYNKIEIGKSKPFYNQEV